MTWQADPKFSRRTLGDHVPWRGVGALLLGGLDRGVRLRWLAG